MNEWVSPMCLRSGFSKSASTCWSSGEAAVKMILPSNALTHRCAGSRLVALNFHASMHGYSPETLRRPHSRGCLTHCRDAQRWFIRMAYFSSKYLLYHFNKILNQWFLTKSAAGLFGLCECHLWLAEYLRRQGLSNATPFLLSRSKTADKLRQETAGVLGWGDGLSQTFHGMHQDLQTDINNTGDSQTILSAIQM